MTISNRKRMTRSVSRTRVSKPVRKASGVARMSASKTTVRSGLPARPIRGRKVTRTKIAASSTTTGSALRPRKIAANLRRAGRKAARRVRRATFRSRRAAAA